MQQSERKMRERNDVPTATRRVGKQGSAISLFYEAIKHVKIEINGISTRSRDFWLVPLEDRISLTLLRTRKMNKQRNMSLWNAGQQCGRFRIKMLHARRQKL